MQITLPDIFLGLDVQRKSIMLLIVGNLAFDKIRLQDCVSNIMHLLLLLQGLCIPMAQSVLTPRQETTFTTQPILKIPPWGTGNSMHDAANRTIRFISQKRARAANHTLCQDNVAASRVVTPEIVRFGRRRYILMKFQHQQLSMATPLLMGTGMCR